MQKIDPDVLKVVLQRNNLDTRRIAQILEDLATEARESTEEKELQVKKQFVVLLSDPDGVVINASFKDKEIAAWIVQIPEEESPFSVLKLLDDSASDYNTSKKGRRFPVLNVADACETLKPSCTKEHGLWIRTKLPVALVPTNGVLKI